MTERAPNDMWAGRHALVTGASRGIGKAIAMELAAAGLAVTVVYRADRDGAADTVEAIERSGGRAMMIAADVSSEDDVKAMASEAKAALGPVTVLVNNAGVGVAADVFEATAADFDRTMAVNVRSAFLASQAVIGDMRDQGFGRLIFLSSVAAAVGGVVSSAYAASKAGVIGMMHFYALSLREYGVTANAIAPGPVESDMLTGLNFPSPESMPMKRVGRPEEIAHVCRAILECGYMTGQTVFVDGGRYMT